MDYALVTGSTSGIGLAIAKKLLTEGCYVFLNYAHNEEHANAAAGELSAIGSSFEIIRADLSGYHGAEELVKAVSQRAEKIKYLVLNCGMTDRTSFGEITPEIWDKVMNANINVPFFLLQGLYNNMRENGAVVCVSSLMATAPHSVSVSYGVSKAAMSALCKNMVKFLANKNIRINAIEPGFIDTPWQKEKPSEQRARIESKIALKRFGQPEEVAGMCWSVLTNGYINSAIIPVCGGYCME